MWDSSRKAVLWVFLTLQPKKCSKRLRRKPSDFQMTFIDSRSLQVQVKSCCTHMRLDIFKLMVINAESPWLFKFVDYNRPIYAPNEHEILQIYSFIWHLRWTEWSMCLQVDNTYTVYVKTYQKHTLTLLHLKASPCSMETLMSALLLTQVCSQGQKRLSVLLCGHVEEEEEEARSLPNRNTLLRLCFPHLRLQLSYEKL